MRPKNLFALSVRESLSALHRLPKEEEADHHEPTGQSEERYEFKPFDERACCEGNKESAAEDGTHAQRVVRLSADQRRIHEEVAALADLVADDKKHHA